MDALLYARGGQLPFELADAVALSEEEAAAVQVDENVRRAISEAVADARGR